MTYRASATLRFQCGRGHAYTGTNAAPEGWFCLHGDCAAGTGVFDGPEGELRRVRAVFDEFVAYDASRPRLTQGKDEGTHDD